MDAGRFHVPSVEVALSALGGSLLGLLRLRLRDPHTVDDAAVDQFAEAMLRMLGVPQTEAARLATLPLPDPHLASQPD